MRRKRTFKSAHLVICQGCKNHGHIRFSDGSDTSEFRDKEKAHYLVHWATEKGKITFEEVDYLHEEIDLLDIPEIPDICEEIAGRLIISPQQTANRELN